MNDAYLLLLQGLTGDGHVRMQTKPFIFYEALSRRSLERSPAVLVSEVPSDVYGRADLPSATVIPNSEPGLIPNTTAAV